MVQDVSNCSVGPTPGGSPGGPPGGPWVSVVVPARNAARTIDAAMDTVLAGQDVPLELIVVDDGSSDDTAGRVEARRHSDPRVRLLHTPCPGSGPSVARNLAIEAATGTWIALLDADDRFRPDRLARLAALGERLEADIVGDNLNLVPADMSAGSRSDEGARPAFGEDGPPHLGRIDTAGFVESNMFHTGRMSWGYMKPLIRRRLLVETGVRYEPGIRICEDYQLYFDLLRAGARFVYTAEALYDYTLRPGSLSRSLGPADLERLRALARRDAQSVRAAGEHRLAGIIDRRQREIESLLLYGQFVEALKALRIGAALGVGLRSPVLWPLILRYGRESLGKRLSGTRRPAGTVRA